MNQKSDFDPHNLSKYRIEEPYSGVNLKRIEKELSAVFESASPLSDEVASTLIANKTSTRNQLNPSGLGKNILLGLVGTFCLCGLIYSAYHQLESQQVVKKHIIADANQLQPTTQEKEVNAGRQLDVQQQEVSEELAAPAHRPKRKRKKRRLHSKKTQSNKEEPIPSLPHLKPVMLAEVDKADAQQDISEVDLFNRGFRLFKTKNYDGADEIFKTYLARFRTGQLRQEALLYLFDIALHRYYSKDIIHYGLQALSYPLGDKRRHHIIEEILKAAFRTQDCELVKSTMKQKGIDLKIIEKNPCK